MKKFLKRALGLLLKLVLAILLITVGWVIVYRYVNPPLTPIMVMRYMEDSAGIGKKWRDYGSVSDNMKLAVIAAEDQKFALHNGFDLESIQDAIVDKLEGKDLRGASTISQQTAKNVFLWPMSRLRTGRAHARHASPARP